MLTTQSGHVIRVMEARDSRVETGIIQFGDDWPGVFIRGDSAIHAAMVLRQILDGEIPATGGESSEQLQRGPVEALCDLLAGARLP